MEEEEEEEEKEEKEEEGGGGNGHEKEVCGLAGVTPLSPLSHLSPFRATIGALLLPPSLGGSGIAHRLTGPNGHMHITTIRGRFRLHDTSHLLLLLLPSLYPFSFLLSFITPFASLPPRPVLTVNK